MSENATSFVTLNICVLTVSDTRSHKNDTSGQKLADGIIEQGHNIFERTLVQDDIYHIRKVISDWIHNPQVHAIITTGGTGFSGRDSTPEAASVLFDKEIIGFGELFRHISYRDIGSSTIQSRALAGFANKTVIFCLPGSTGACATAWNDIIAQQLDSRSKPCNFVSQLISPSIISPKI